MSGMWSGIYKDGASKWAIGMQFAAFPRRCLSFITPMKLSPILGRPGLALNAGAYISRSNR
jgi:hypothetical protein